MSIRIHVANLGWSDDLHSAGLGAMVIAGICYQIANRGRDQREGHGKNPLRFRADRLSALAIRRRPAPSIRGS